MRVCHSVGFAVGSTRGGDRLISISMGSERRRSHGDSEENKSIVVLRLRHLDPVVASSFSCLLDGSRQEFEECSAVLPIPWKGRKGHVHPCYYD